MAMLLPNCTCVGRKILWPKIFVNMNFANACIVKFLHARNIYYVMGC